MQKPEDHQELTKKFETRIDVRQEIARARVSQRQRFLAHLQASMTQDEMTRRNYRQSVMKITATGISLIGLGVLGPLALWLAGELDAGWVWGGLLLACAGGALLRWSLPRLPKA